MLDARPLKGVNQPIPQIALLFDQIDRYGFTCEAGPLKNCVEWIKLKEIVMSKKGSRKGGRRC